MKEWDEWHTGEGIAKWSKCFDCGQRFHGAVKLALGWACWKTYLGRPATDGYRTDAMDTLGGALRPTRPEEALSVLEASFALRRRFWSHDERAILIAQSSLASCLADLDRHDEALVLKRKTYARDLALFGASHEDTIVDGGNVVISLNHLELWEESKKLASDQLLPAARRSLGADHDLTLRLNQNLAAALANDPRRTRDDLRLNQRGVASPRHDLNTGDDLLEAKTIMQDVVQRRRRVFGPAHPETRHSERSLSVIRAQLNST